jgi:4-hydroxy-tetrahydrodipicolinate reductase
MMRLLLVGHGRMGQLVETLSRAYGFEPVGYLNRTNNAHGEGITPERSKNVDVAVDFSTGEAVVQNLPKLAAAGINTVIGTTGWNEHEPKLREVIADSGIGVVVAPNFSLGMVLFHEIVAHAARCFINQTEYGAWIHDLHHAAKRDKPSGTALSLKAALEQVGYVRPIDVCSTRAGAIPGTHVVGLDGPFDSITLTHTARDRAVFARGALEAARWIHGKRGWFSVRHVLGLDAARAQVSESRQHAR